MGRGTSPTEPGRGRAWSDMAPVSRALLPSFTGLNCGPFCFSVSRLWRERCQQGLPPGLRTQRCACGGEHVTSRAEKPCSLGSPFGAKRGWEASFPRVQSGADRAAAVGRGGECRHRRGREGAGRRPGADLGAKGASQEPGTEDAGARSKEGPGPGYPAPRGPWAGFGSSTGALGSLPGPGLPF